MNLSNYPPGVTGNEEAINPSDSGYNFLLPGGEGEPEIAVVRHKDGDSVTVTAEAAWNLGRLVGTARDAYRILSQHGIRPCEAPSLPREDEPRVWTYHACGSCVPCRLRRDIEACGGAV